jgi:hypothetical protein
MRSGLKGCGFSHTVTAPYQLSSRATRDVSLRTEGESRDLHFFGSPDLLSPSQGVTSITDAGDAIHSLM